jgi:glycosyltransferase involved in cell wall biosynthesis
MVSICVLVYNQSKVLQDALTSILEQTWSEFELIVSDDCSTDDSWQVIEHFASRHARVRAIRTPRNLGMAGNANFAIAHAQFEFVALLHHDDIVSPRLLEEWMHVANRQSNIAFVFNDYAIGCGVAAHRIEGRRFTTVMSGPWFLRSVLLSAWSCPVRGTALLRKRCFDELGGMDEQFGLLADVDLWMRLSSRWDVGYVDSALIRVLTPERTEYPREYTQFSWKRLHILFSIHAENLKRLQDPVRLRTQLRWLRHRMNVSRETSKWLVYAVVKRRKDIVEGSTERPSPGEYPVVWLVRALARLALTVLPAARATPTARRIQ